MAVSIIHDCDPGNDDALGILVALGSPGLALEAVTTGADHLAGDRRGFLETVKQLRPRLHRYCARMTEAVMDGEDVMQEALFEAYRKLDRFDDSRPLTPGYRASPITAALTFFARSASAVTPKPWRPYPTRSCPPSPSDSRSAGNSIDWSSTCHRRSELVSCRRMYSTIRSRKLLSWSTLPLAASRPRSIGILSDVLAGSGHW
jgi:Sigma-70 region 2